MDRKPLPFSIPQDNDCPAESGKGIFSDKSQLNCEATKNCIVCGSILAEAFYVKLLRCSKCGHVFADLHLSDAELLNLYCKSYFFGGEYSNYIENKNVLQKNFKLRIEVLTNFLDPARHKNIFEIGSAYGFFLDLAKKYFEDISGIDINEDGVIYAQKELHLDVIHGDFLKHKFSGINFDIVCMWDTIEHLRNPDIYIEKLSRHMEKGALLAITTGDIESLNARFKKHKWRLIHPPTHVHYFSKKTLTRLLKNYGFNVIYNRYCGFYRSIDAMAYNILVKRHNKVWLYKILRYLNLTTSSVYLNLYDIMFVIARKE